MTRPLLTHDDVIALLHLLDGFAVEDRERATVERMRATAYGYTHPLFDLANHRARYFETLAVEAELVAQRLRADHADVLAGAA